MHVLSRLRGQQAWRSLSQLRRQSCVASCPAGSRAGKISTVNEANFQASGLWRIGTLELDNSHPLRVLDQPHESDQHYGSESGNQYGVQEPASHTDTQETKDPAADKGPYNAQQNVANHAKAGAAHDLASQPARN